jgi:peroxiredoxin
MHLLTINIFKTIRLRQLFLTVFLLSSICCRSATDKPSVEPAYILKNVKNYLYYTNTYLKLSESFKALDINGKSIAKAQFFKAMMTNRYVPVRLQSATLTFRLFPIKTTGDAMIPRLIGELGKHYYKYLKMEGQKLPSLDFTDLNGHLYNAANTRGKTLILKFWYISCVMCVKEMPELNDLVESYKRNKNVQFLSLAFDTAPKLKKFLKEHRFVYPVVPNMESYAENLNITAYPTHLIVRDGKIIKAVGSAQELISAMRTEIKN